jgi:transposase
VSRELIEATGARLLFLLPYSPDLNPIEKTFGSMKRKRSEQPDLSLDELQAVLLIIELTIVPAPTGHRSGALL